MLFPNFIHYHSTLKEVPCISCICSKLCGEDNIHPFLGIENSTLIPVLLINHCTQRITSFLHFYCHIIKIRVRVKASSKSEGRRMKCFAIKTPWRWWEVPSRRGTRAQCHGKMWIQTEPDRLRNTQGQSSATWQVFGSSKPQFPPLWNGLNHIHLSGKDAISVAKKLYFLWCWNLVPWSLPLTFPWH